MDFLTNHPFWTLTYLVLTLILSFPFAAIWSKSYHSAETKVGYFLLAWSLMPFWVTVMIIAFLVASLENLIERTRDVLEID